MEQTFASFLNIKDMEQEGAKPFLAHTFTSPTEMPQNVVEQSVIEGEAQFWDCSWHPLTKEVNIMLKNGEKLDYSTFLGFLDHNFELSTWCNQCFETIFGMKQEEIIKIEGNKYTYKFFVCKDCAQIIKYATFHF
uniref:Uncharacterized protein n=1 Tax=Meloidogyne incognita TaxID=6306 RepID=A0A914L7I5_MELIC